MMTRPHFAALAALAAVLLVTHAGPDAVCAAPSPWPDASCDAGAPVACLASARRDLAVGRRAAGLERLWRALEGDDPGAFMLLQDLAASGAPADFPWSDRAASTRVACDSGTQPRACLLLGKLHLFGLGLPADLAAGVAAFDRACAGDPWACTGNALVLSHGTGVARDAAAAVAALRAACAAGNANHGCRQLANALKDGKLAAQDLPGMVAALVAGCSGGDAVSCKSLGEGHATGRGGLGRDDAKAVEHFRRACDGGEPDGCVRLARHQLHGAGTAKDPVAAGRLLTAVCDASHPAACSDLGDLYEAGVGVPANPSRMAALYARACDGHVAHACARLGLAHIHGLGVPRDPVAGLALITKGCDARDAEACARLGELLLHAPEGIPGDPARAATLLAAVCEAGLPDACGVHGVQLARGLGVPADPKAGVALIERACSAGRVRSCSDLAFAYLRGVGVPQDLDRADRLAEDACKAGDQTACQQHRVAIKVARDLAAVRQRALARTEVLTLPAGGLKVRVAPGHGWVLQPAGSDPRVDRLEHRASGLVLALRHFAEPPEGTCGPHLEGLAKASGGKVHRRVAWVPSSWEPIVVEETRAGTTTLTVCQDDGFWDALHVTRLAHIKRKDGRAPSPADLETVRELLGEIDPDW